MLILPRALLSNQNEGAASTRRTFATPLSQWNVTAFSMPFLTQCDERVLHEVAVGFTDVGTGDVTVAALHPASSLQLESFTQSSEPESFRKVCLDGNFNRPST